MTNDVQLIVTIGETITEPTTFPSTSSSVVDGQTTINLGSLNPAFSCANPQVVIQAGAVVNVPSATGNSTANVISYDPNTCTIEVDTPIYWSGVTPVSCDVIIDITTDTTQDYIIDLYENESISQNWQFTDISSFASIGAFSREFRIPANENNITILGALHDATYTPTTNYYTTKLPARIMVDSLPISTGHIRVIKAYRQLDKICDFEVSFYGDTPDIIRTLGASKLKDLDYSDITSSFIYEDVTENNIDPNLRYILTDRGQRWSEEGEANTRQVLNPDTPVYAGDMTPVMNAGYLLRKIFNTAGFEIDTTAVDSYIDAYWIPWIINKYNDGTDPNTQYKFNLGLTNNITSITSDDVVSPMTAFIDLNSDVIGAWYQVPFTGYYKFKVWATLQDNPPVVGPNGVIGIQLRSNSVMADAGSQPIAVQNLFWNRTLVPTANVQYTTESILLTQGTYVYQKIFTDHVGHVILADALNNPNYGTGFELVEFSGALYGNAFNANVNAPDIKQVDYVRDIITMHQLAFVPDPNIPKKAMVVPMVDYIGSGTSEDWTNKLDTEKDITIAPTTDYQSRDIIFSYKSGGDIANQLYQAKNRIYGDYKINGYTTAEGEVPNEFAQGELKVELTAESTPCNYIKGTGIVVPKFVNDKGEFVVPNLRFLFLAGTAEIQLYDEQADVVALTEVYLGNHYSTINASVADYDLNFAPETPLHSILSNPYNNLFNLFYRSYMNEIYSPECRVMTAFFNLDLTDILSFSFANKYYIKDSYWRVLSINDYKVGMGETTQVTLIKLVNRYADCAMIPDGQDEDGIIQFVDFDGNPVEGTQPCCVRYGYSWSTELNGCIELQTSDDNPFPTGEAKAMLLASSAPTNALTQLAGSNIAKSNSFSVFAGSNITIEDGNERMIAVGDTMNAIETLASPAMFGRNVMTRSGGLHIGGGWLGDDRTMSLGQSQMGIIPHGADGSWSSSGTSIALVRDNLKNTFLNLADGSSMACIVVINVSKDNIANWGYGVFSFMIWKSGTAGASAVNTIYTTNNFTSFTLGLTIDTTTNTAEHRFNVTATGTGFPHNDVRIIGQLNYTQFNT